MRIRNQKMVEASHAVEEAWFHLRKYRWFRCDRPSRQMLVHFVTEGHFYSGGMMDRFKGIITAYAWCLCHGVDFRINYTYPFRLDEYLRPSSYDWTLKEGELSDSLINTRVVYARGEHGSRLASLKTSRQIHYYGNMDCLDLMNRTFGKSFVWGELFKELFVPQADLQDCIDRQKTAIGGAYDAAVFRFQNLLGDFEEYGLKEISSANKKDILLEKCLAWVKSRTEELAGKPLLVTADSRTFLDEVSSIPGVYVIPGRVAHMGGSGSTEDYTVWLKSFLDFYMLTESDRIDSVCTQEMYPSEFPLYAAKVNDIPFSRIRL